MVKILNLILYSDTGCYNDMRDILRTYHRVLSPKVYKFMFYCYKPDLKKDYDIQDDMLYIKGTETYVPGILQKTIDAFKICIKFDFTHLIRSNASTIVDFTRLVDILDGSDISYGGNTVLEVLFKDKAAGLVDAKYFRTKYAHGACMIFSKKMAEYIVKNENKFDYTIIDDVAFGVFYAKCFPGAGITNFGQFNKINSETYCEDGVFYRNRHEDRSDDIRTMKNIVGELVKLSS